MKQRKEIRILPYAVVFVALAAVVFVWLCGYGAAVWAGFNGFGDPALEYTAEGEKAILLLLGIPILFLMILLLARLGRNIKRKEAISRYVKDLFFFIAAISMGVVFFYYVPGPSEMIGKFFMRLIRQTGWMGYPIP